jgi:hypothetical protein
MPVGNSINAGNETRGAGGNSGPTGNKSALSVPETRGYPKNPVVLSRLWTKILKLGKFLPRVGAKVTP